MQQDVDAPPGWTYNPSARRQRLPILILSLLNCGIASYLAVRQIWFHGNAWDPFFGAGTRQVLTSAVSRAFPVSDAALGAGAYLLEAIFGVLGDRVRWRSRPCLVLIFGLLVLPLSVVSVVLMIMQPVVVHAWCSLCLVQAAGMVLMVALALDEVLAAIQFLVGSYHRRPSPDAVWHLLLHGTAPNQANPPCPVPSSLPWSTVAFAGFTPTWNLTACFALGLACLITPAALHVDREASLNIYVIGALVIAISTIAMSEVARSLRFALMLAGIWLLVFAPWTSHNASAGLKTLQVLLGAALLALSYWRGRIRERYADWDRFLI